MLQKADLVEPGLPALDLTRTYRQGDSTSRAFGIGTDFTYSVYMYSTNGYMALDLILPGSTRVHYVRTSPGTWYTDAVFESTETPGAFLGSTIVWNGAGWDLRTKDGTVFVFPDQAPLKSIRDRYGNSITLTRAGGLNSGNITRVSSSSGRWIALSYDASNRITSASDSAGRTVGYQYDPTGRLWKVTNPAGGVTEYSYNALNQMTALKDARGITFLQNQYDANGRVSLQTQADDTTYEFDYTLDGAGKVIQTLVTDPRGFVRRVTFNTTGFSHADTAALGQPEERTITFVRQAGSNLPTSVTDGLGRRTEYEYDSVGNVESVTRLAGTGDSVTTTMTYEPVFNQIESITDPLDHTTSFEYDTAGSLITVTDPLDKDTTFTYNVAGQPVTITDPTNKTTDLTYRLGDLVATTDPLGRTTKQFINSAGRAGSATNALGERTRTVFDPLNRPMNVIAPLGGATAFAYDPNGNVLTVTDARGGVTTYTYDAMDRVASRQDPLLHTETFTYDAAGAPMSATDRKGLVTTATYDALGRRTFVGFDTVTNGGSTTYESTIETTLDAADRVTQLVDSGSGTITFGYDDLDRLTLETTPQGVVTYAFDDAGRRTRMTLAGQPDVTYAYDVGDRPTAITQGTSAVGLTYDDAGRQLTVNLPNGILGTYAYDDASQLTSLTYEHDGGGTVGDLTYTYDRAGRRTTVAGSLARTALPPGMSGATYNANNQLTSWQGFALTYDLNGNLTWDVFRSYTWNARNELTQLQEGQTTIASFAYDATARRISKTIAGSATSFASDGGNFVQEQDATGTPTANLLTGGIDQVFSRTDVAGGATYLTDALGSTVAMADATGAIQTSYTYDPYGNTTVTGAASSNSQQFTGRENDGTSLYFYRARYYFPSFGRFISEDPAGFAGGDTNLYRYVGNSPTNATDPSGQVAPIVGVLVVVCGFGAVISAFETITRIFTPDMLGRRKTWNDVPKSAARGCVLNLMFFGVGTVASKNSPASYAGTTYPKRAASASAPRME